MSSRKNILLLAFLLMAVVPLAFAQDEEPCDWGYLFSWQPNFDIGKYHVGSVYNSSNTKLPLVGIGAERYLSKNWGVQLGFNFGLDNSSQEDTVRTVDNNALDLGLKVGANYYFQGKDKTISPYIGGWASYSLYNETLTDKPVTGTEFKREYSASTIGIGVTGGAYWQPWNDADLDFGFYYNLGVMITPSSTLKITSGGQTAETDGPSRITAGDCGGGINLRLSF
ncbi:MAG: outer membrane beta-barrel protein [Bacteroidota bacterium]